MLSYSRLHTQSWRVLSALSALQPTSAKTYFRDSSGSVCGVNGCVVQVRPCENKCSQQQPLYES